jgi:hypothetical protein
VSQFPYSHFYKMGIIIINLLEAVVRIKWEKAWETWPTVIATAFWITGLCKDVKMGEQSLQVRREILGRRLWPQTQKGQKSFEFKLEESFGWWVL